MYKFNDLPMTVFGKPKQFKVSDYKEILKYSNLLILQDYDIKLRYQRALYKSNDFTNEEKLKSKEVVFGLSFIQLIKNNVYEVGQLYEDFFSFFYEDFKKDLLYNLTEKDFLLLRQLIIDVNQLPFEQKSTNEELASWDSLKGVLNGGITVSIEGIYYSVWAQLKTCPDDMLLYDFNNLFSKFKMIETSRADVILKTVDHKREVFPWFADEKKEVKLISKEELEKKNTASFNKEKIKHLENSYKQ